VPEYVRRFFQIPQMDIDYTLWQMLYLCIAPSRVYRTTKYHKQTKNQWARDGLFPTVAVVLRSRELHRWAPQRPLPSLP
jgi:UNC-50 family